MPLRAYHDIDHAKSTLLVGVLDILDFLVVWASLFFSFLLPGVLADSVNCQTLVAAPFPLLGIDWSQSLKH